MTGVSSGQWLTIVVIYRPCDQRATKVAVLIAVHWYAIVLIVIFLIYLIILLLFFLLFLSFLSLLLLLLCRCFIVVVALSNFGGGWVGFIFVSVLGFVLAGFCYHPYKWHAPHRPPKRFKQRPYNDTYPAWFAKRNWSRHNSFPPMCRQSFRSAWLRFMRQAQNR